MITMTDQARAKVLEFMKAQEKDAAQVLRVAVAGQGAGGPGYEFFLEEEASVPPGDRLVALGEVKVVMDAVSAPRLEGAEIDWKESPESSGFVVSNPNPPALDGDDATVRQLRRLIDEEINPAVASHGGFVQLVDVRDSRVYLRLGGGCQGCGMANQTLRQGIEVRIKQALPQIVEVVDVTDHDGGANPYHP